MERPAEHLEHIEHQEHAAHNPFDKRVAMSMAIIAASLAAVTMLSHKSHNATLLYQSQATNQWNYYQAKNIRQHEYEAFLLLLGSLTKDQSQEAVAQKAQNDWTNQLDKYKTELPEMKKKAEELGKQSQEAHAMAERFDLGELGIELALVFCSLAVLTKRVGFWYGGILVGVIGGIVAVSAYVWIPHH